MTTAPQFNIQIASGLTWNVQPLLHEIKHALIQFSKIEQPSIIDLRSIPLAPGEEDRLLEVLGRGEVQATLNALGSSEVIETRYPGVWLVTHYNEEEAVIGRFIEITDMPEILKSQSQDITQSYQELCEFLESFETETV